MKLKPYHTLLLWLIGTLIAIALIGENLYLGVGVASVAGILFGITNLLAYTSPKSDRKNNE